MRFSVLFLALPIINVGLALAQNSPDSSAPEPIFNCTTVTPDACFNSAPSSFPQPPCYGGSLLERSKLTGNWFGARDTLLANGITFDLSTTQYYQGVAANGLNQSFAYAGRNDYYVNVDGEQAGLWEGLYLTMHGETRYGNTVNANTGSLIPVNIGMQFPTPTGTVSGITALKASQLLSEDVMVFGGKINMLDESKQAYAGGRGVDAFMNANLAFPVALARTVPYSTLGVGFSILRNMQPILSVYVLDTNNTPTTSGFETFFNNGATVFAKVDIPLTFMDLPGHQGFGGTYSTGSYNVLAPTPYFNPQYGPGMTPVSVSDSWSAFYAADQALWVDPNDPRRTWGIFKNFGVADNGPSPVRFSVAFGLGGTSPLLSRPQDTFGVGFSWVQYTNSVQYQPPNQPSLQWDQAVECFYNVAITPWFRLTPDVQILLPARQTSLPPASNPTDTAVVIGVRAKVDF